MILHLTTSHHQQRWYYKGQLGHAHETTRLQGSHRRESVWRLSCHSRLLEACQTRRTHHQHCQRRWTNWQCQCHEIRQCNSARDCSPWVLGRGTMMTSERTNPCLCGYDLRSADRGGRCPECGRSIADIWRIARRRARSNRHGRAALVGLVGHIGGELTYGEDFYHKAIDLFLGK